MAGFLFPRTSSFANLDGFYFLRAVEGCLYPPLLPPSERNFPTPAFFPLQFFSEFSLFFSWGDKEPWGGGGQGFSFSEKSCFRWEFRGFFLFALSLHLAKPDRLVPSPPNRSKLPPTLPLLVFPFFFIRFPPPQKTPPR